jgi:fission process protein 1
MTSTNPNNESISQQVKGEIDSLVERDIDTVDSDIRYVAYGARLRTALRASSRYIAYVSNPQSFGRTFAK